MSTLTTTATVTFDDSNPQGIHLCKCDRDLIATAMVVAGGEPEIDPTVEATIVAAQKMILLTVELTVKRLPFFFSPCVKSLFILTERQLSAIRTILSAYQVMISETLQGDMLTELGAKDLVEQAEKARKLAHRLAQPVSSNS